MQITTLKTEHKQKIGKQLVTYVTDLMSVKFDAIGSFSPNLELTGCFHDGPHLGPFPNHLEWCKAVIQFTLEELQRHPYLQEVRQLFETSLPVILCKIDSMYKLTSQDEDIVLCHSDLHPGNVLVDADTFEVSAILDWEHAKATPWHGQWSSLRLFWGDESDPEEKLAEFMDEQLLLLTGKEFKPSPNQDLDFEEESCECEIELWTPCLASDIRTHCEGILFWCATWFLQDYLAKGKYDFEDMKKIAEGGIRDEIKRKAQRFEKFSKGFVKQ